MLVDFQVVIGLVGLPAFHVQPFLFHLLKIDIVAFFNGVEEPFVDWEKAKTVSCWTFREGIKGDKWI